jgi:hypothetical protein
MAKGKAKRNARTMKAHRSFKICRQPVVRASADDPSPYLSDGVGLPRVRGRPFLFAIARDACTIFASWNIDWESIFEKAMPADRKVHLRVIGGDCVEEKTVPVEPMIGMHYLTIPRPRDSYRIEIGYFQPAGTWHSVAISEGIDMPPQRSAEIADVDLATIPLHLSFQQLLDVFGTPNGAQLAKVVSEFQKRAISSKEPNEPTSIETEILRKLNLSVSEIAAAQRDFEESDREKLTRRVAALLRFKATSPVRGFDAISGS